MCQELGIEGVDPAIAGCFAGGIGNTGSVCGAVAGAVMAIGLERGRPASEEAWLDHLGVAAEFRRRFEDEMGGDITCRALTGMDMSTPEGVERFVKSDVPQTVCFPAVGVAYRLAVDLLRKGS